MHTYSVSIPFTGTVVVVVKADNEKQAKRLAASKPYSMYLEDGDIDYYDIDMSASEADAEVLEDE